MGGGSYKQYFLIIYTQESCLDGKSASCRVYSQAGKKKKEEPSEIISVTFTSNISN